MGSPIQRPTIVLVHGAFEDASIWSGVIAGLQNERSQSLHSAIRYLE